MRNFVLYYTKLRTLVSNSIVIKFAVFYAVVSGSVALFVLYNSSINTWLKYEFTICLAIFYSIINFWSFILLRHIKDNQDKINKLKLHDNNLLRINEKTTQVKEKINLYKKTVEELNIWIAFLQGILPILALLDIFILQR